MRYLGNKESIVSEIYLLLSDKGLINKDLSFFDAFCGSGSVADYFKEYYNNIIINDNLTWSVVYTAGRLCSQHCSFSRLGFDPIEYFNNSNDVAHEFIYKNYSPADDAPVCKRLQYYRKRKGLTQSEAAGLIGLDRRTYIRWEARSLKYYPMDKLTKAAEIFGCDVSDLADSYDMFLLNAPDKIRSLRKSLHLTQKELARRLGVNVGTVKEWERGVKRPSKKSYERIMRIEV